MPTTYWPRVPSGLGRARRWLVPAVLAAATAWPSAGWTEDPDLAYRIVARPATGDRGMVVSSSADANRVGLEILAAGGNAVDAAVAVAIALGAVDPGNSGLGGGTTILVRMADGRAVAIDGSAVVPVAVNWPALRRIQDEGRKFGPALAAVPGTLAALDHALRRFGTITLAAAVAPSVALAEAGYRLTPFQRAASAKYLADIRTISPLDRILLTPAGGLKPVGALVRWPGLARTLRRLVAGGAADFYRGAIAAEIDADMIRRGGPVRRGDLALYRVHELAPLRTSYRGREVLSFPLPGAGGAVVAGLNTLACFPPEVLRRDDELRLQIMAEAFRIALADERRTVDRAGLPQRLHDTDYLSLAHAAGRAALIVPGEPVPADALGPLEWRPELDSQTVEVSVVDAAGNAVALTQSLGRFYGNKVVAAGLGFPYNTFLGALDAHHPEEVRQRSPIVVDGAPTIVLADGAPLLVLGAAGSSRIPGAIATVISNVVDRGMTLGDAVAAPRVLWSMGDSTRGLLLEARPPVTVAHALALEEMGYEYGRCVTLPVPYQDLSSYGAVNAVHRDPSSGRLTGVGDPRRNGDARGLP